MPNSKHEDKSNKGAKACNTGWRANLAKPSDVLGSFVVITIWTLVRTGASRQLGLNGFQARTVAHHMALQKHSVND